MLQLKYFIVLLLLLACSSPYANAKKSKPQKPKISKFNVVLDNGKKAAIQVKEKNDVYTVTSKSKSLTASGYGAATVIFDYSKNNQAMILVTGKGKNAVCRYTDFPVSKSDFQDTLKGQKNSDVTFSGTLGLDGRGDAKKKSDVKKWLKKFASVKRLCKKASIIELTTLDPNEDFSSAENETFVGIDGYLEIVKQSNSFIQPLTKPFPVPGVGSAFSFIQPRLPGLGGNSASGGASSGNNRLVVGGASVTVIGGGGSGGGGSGGGGSGGTSNVVANASGGTSGGSNTGGQNNGKKAKNKKNKNKKKKNNKAKKD